MSGGGPGRFHPPARLTVPELLAATGGKLVAGPADGAWSICTDTRELTDDAVFVAIRGEVHDGHDWVPRALANHRTGAIVERAPERATLAAAAGPVIVVPDSLVALGDVARAHLLKTGPTVAAVTGSVGKTTTRAMLAAMMEQVAPGLVTEGNFNNRIGLPLTLLALTPEHRWAVLEMGMSEQGEIRALAAIARPHVRVITTVSEGHLEFFDDVEGIARAKGELFEDARPGDVLVSERGAWFGDLLPRPPGAHFVTFGGEGAAVQATDLQHLGLRGTRATLHFYGDPQDVFIPVPGRHQLHNAMAAAAAALHLGAKGPQIAAGLAKLELPGRRMRVDDVRGLTVVDDAYNANPASVRSALATVGALDRQPGTKLVAALGDMLELGPEAARLHAEVGEQAARAGVTLLIGAGPLMAHAVEAAKKVGVQAVAVADSDAAGGLLRGRLKAGDVLLVKGSRGMRMERVLELLAEER